MASALHKRPGAQLVVISTAGQGADSPLGALRARALALPSVKRSGSVTDARGPSLRMLAWELDDDADVDDARILKRVNPASRITVEQLRHAREALPDLAYRRVRRQQVDRARRALAAAGRVAADRRPAGDRRGRGDLARHRRRRRRP
jgi:phage terminase large subunit-like protein